MSDNPNDLLREPWISTVDADNRHQQLTLPQVLSHLGNGNELEFTALQGHQQQAWYAFLVQLSALALHWVGGELDQDAEAWTTTLEQLADAPTGWHLVADDLHHPAFFQPPVTEGDLGKFKRRSGSPEILEILIAAKNHDIKADRYGPAASTEHWAFSLLTLQTMEGFLGRGNYGIARMNGGFSSRPETTLATGDGWSERLRRDVDVLLRIRPHLIDNFGFSAQGVSLLWLRPWQGGKHEFLTIGDLDPFYLEVCRRVRLTREDEQIIAQVAPSDAPRVDAKERLGNVGDPWTPIRKDGAALTVSENGFHYRLLAELLFGDDFQKPPLLECQPDERGEMVALFRVLARGQGKTGGFHERQLPIPPKVLGRLGNDQAKTSLAKTSRWRIEQSSMVQKKLLKPALLRLVQERVQAPTASSLNWKDERAAAWLGRFDEAVDAIFFEFLFGDAEADLPIEEGHHRWNLQLFELAQQTFDAACQVLAPSGIHRYRALARAESFLLGRGTQILNLTSTTPTFIGSPESPRTVSAEEIHP